MNKNISNMFEDLKKEFSENIYQKLDLVIYDNDGNRYSKDDGFKEELFNKLFINYETDIVVIDRYGYSLFDISAGIPGPGPAPRQPPPRAAPRRRRSAPSPA